MVQVHIQELLRRLPGVDVLIQMEGIQKALARHPRKLIIESIRQIVDEKRQSIMASPEDVEKIDIAPEHLQQLILARLGDLSEFTLRTVVNGTGIIVHTNLGRSLLPEEAIERLEALCRSYNNLEYDLENGRRGSRYVHAEAILCELTGAEAALVVNNNAGAVFLVLSTMAAGREVVVSRGQLVEIGGSFRIPDVMRSSGAILKEVGTTNRTHLRDYEGAINENTALLMKVHTSNYRIIGFTAEVSLRDLVSLGTRRGVPVMEDLGSGSLVDFSKFGLSGEPTVQEAIGAGADIITFSGDKLLGGPQAGIVLGRKDIVARCRQNPMTRALRVDKMTLAVLETTLRLYRDERTVVEKVPTLRMIATPLPILEARAHRLISIINEMDSKRQLHVEVLPGVSQVGGGSLPGYDLESRLVAVACKYMSTARIEAHLRGGKPPIIGRVESDRFLLDVRTLQDHELPVIRDAFENMLAKI